VRGGAVAQIEDPSGNGVASASSGPGGAVAASESAGVAGAAITATSSATTGEAGGAGTIAAEADTQNSQATVAPIIVPPPAPIAPGPVWGGAPTGPT